MTILMTGAHVTPAVALTQSLIEKVPSAHIVYVGRNIDSVEQSEVERVGAHFKAITSGKLHRFPTLSQVIEFGKIPVGFIQAVSLLRREKPDIIVSFGGYLSVPIVMAGNLFHIPVVIHEETTVWGLANRICRHFASAVAVSWPHMEEPGVELTGNPIPREIVEIGIRGKRDEQIEKGPGQKRNILYITEGSQASLVISTIVKKVLEELLKDFDVYHQTKYPPKGISDPRYHTARWFRTPQHAKLLSQTSLAVSRAGANTVTYYAYVGVPSLLIPLPHAGENEQMSNAQLLSETGLSRIIPQTELSPERLLSEITNMTAQTKDELKKSRIRARALVNGNAASLLADLVLKQCREV